MIGVIDYGMGNIQSVLNALEKVGSPARIVTTSEAMEDCGGLVLPGVGAFSKAMDNLAGMGLVGAIRKSVESGTPLLGICLGLQLLAEESDEHGRHEGLGIIPGRVRRLPVAPGYRLPHIGWNEVKLTPLGDAGMFAGIKDDSTFYFVHSYMLECDPKFIAATTDHGCTVTAAVQSGAVYAAQFHPEKSQANGLRLLRNFVRRVAGTAAAGATHA